MLRGSECGKGMIDVAVTKRRHKVIVIRASWIEAREKCCADGG